MTSSSPERIGTAVVVGVALIGSVWLHITAGLVFPIPWPDEAAFLWPARHLAEAGSLAAPELNPQRAVYWMPPGYSLLVSGVLGSAATDLGSARWLSWGLVVGAYLAFLALLRGPRARAATTLLASFMLISSQWVAAANVARMESLLLLMVTGGFLLIQRSRHLAGMALLALGLLVHPNAIFFLVAAGVYCAFLERPRVRHHSAIERVLAAVVVLSLLAYAWYLARSWAFVLEDMGYQFRLKGARSGTASRVAIMLILSITVTAFAARAVREHALQIMFCIAGLAAAFIGREMWYEALGVLAIVTALHVLLAAFPRPLPESATAAVAIVLIGAAQLTGRIATPAQRHVSWYGMKLRCEVPYATAADGAALMDLIDEVAGARTARLAFEPAGDSLLFPMRGHKVLYPLFTATRPDVVVVHHSRCFPAADAHGDPARDVTADVLGASGRHLSRDGTETWFVARAR